MPKLIYECPKCGDTGVCTVSVNDAGEITARIRCDCPKGKAKRGRKPKGEAICCK